MIKPIASSDYEKDIAPLLNQLFTQDEPFSPSPFHEDIPAKKNII